MFSRNFFLSFFIFIFAVITANSTDLNKPLGVEFGTSKKDVEKMIEANDILILKDEEQTKYIRRLIVNGQLTDSHDVDAVHSETRLEFYKNKLMSSALFFKFDDEYKMNKAKEIYVDNIKNEFGEAQGQEKMLSYQLLTWSTPSTKILLNSNEKNNSLKLEFINEPMMAKKIKKEIDKKLYGEFEDPAKKTFIDGDYSKPKYGR